MKKITTVFLIFFSCMLGLLLANAQTVTPQNIQTLQGQYDDAVSKAGIDKFQIGLEQAAQARDEADLAKQEIVINQAGTYLQEWAASQKVNEVDNATENEVDNSTTNIVDNGTTNTADNSVTDNSVVTNATGI